MVFDDYQPAPLFDTTVDLVKDHPIDPTGLHATGQSMGAMMTPGLGIKHPAMFASSYVVAGQWPAARAEQCAGHGPTVV